MRNPFRVVVIGLTITSSWGNGHATTYRALLRALSGLGHQVLFLERDAPWYAAQRDTKNPLGCSVLLYDSLAGLERQCHDAVRDADVVIVGSYVPDGAEVLSWVLDTARGLRLFYDIDTPVTLSKLAAGEATYIGPESIPKLDAYLSFTGGPTLLELQQRFGAPLALPLFCSVDQRVYVPRGQPKDRDLGYLGTYSADRQPALDRLLLEPARRLDSRRFVVAGPCYPEGCEWPSNVERLEHVAPGDHTGFYGSLRFALNVTRADMVRRGYSPSVRLFEAAACATPIISDRWPGIERFFEPGREILLCDSADEVQAILTGLDEEERLSIGRRSRERVLQQHSASHRALELDRYLRELYAGRSGLLRAISAYETGAHQETLSAASGMAKTGTQSLES